MKKKISFSLMSIITFFSFIGVAIGTFSWFMASVKTAPYNLNGKSAGAYFAYGDGLPYEEDEDGKVIHRPFGISIPRHLYNLSWLQYTGQFTNDQFYFEIAESVDDDEGLDMDGYILPPIGTETDPFVGNFNGNGKIIKNLTVTNDEDVLFSGSNKHPDQTQVIYYPSKIVGFFGVVGNYGDNYGGEVAYSSSINEIKDLGITDFTISTTTNQALVGVCAGYVDATISNVAVNNSTIDVQADNTAAVDSTNLTENLSDYGVVGYATSDYKKSIKKINHELYGIEIGPNAEFNATDSGDVLGWGGSIDMNSIFTRLTNIRGSNDTTNYPFETTVSHYDNDLYSEPTVASTSNQSVYRFVGYGSDDNTHDYRGSIVYGYSDGSANSRTKHYLLGGTYQTHNYYSYYEHTGVKISDGNSHYLTATNLGANTRAIANTNDADNAIVWVIESGNTPRIYTEYNGTPYYLYRVNDTSLGLTNNAGTATRWNKETNATNNGVRYTYNNRMIAYSNGWTLVEAPQMPTYPALPVDPYDEPVFNQQEPVFDQQEPEPLEEVANPGTKPAEPFEPVSIGWQLFNTNRNYFLVATNNTTFTRSTSPFNGGWEWTGTLTNGSTGNIRLKNSPTYLLRHPTGNSRTLALSNTANNNSPDWTLIVTNGNYKFRYYENNNPSRARYLQYGGTTYFRASNRNDDTNNVFSFTEYATYKNQTMTLSEANTAYASDLAEYEGWDAANEAYEEYLEELAAWQIEHDAWEDAYNEWLPVHDAWQAGHDAWQANHAQWEADNYYRETEFPAAVEQYNSDLTTYNNSFYINTTAVTAENPVRGPDYHQTAADTAASGAKKMNYTYEDTTYFPINVDSTNNAKLENTGYFVAGTTSAAWANESSCPRSLIFSSYTKTGTNGKIKGYDNTNKVIPNNQIYTVDFNQSNQLNPHVLNLDDPEFNTKYSKYYDSKAGFEKVIKNASKIGGFHFYAKTGTMGFISKDAVVKAKDVRMRGESYNKYELPVNSLDFYLREKGRVNFFAGMYNGGTEGDGYGTITGDHMNGFFSLFRVFRDNNNHITDIREVQAIYGNESHNNWSYIYEYKNGKFSEPYRISVNSKYVLTPDGAGTTPYVENHDLTSISTYTSSTYGYKKLFDNDWLGYYDYSASSTYWGRVFYFEIPTDQGEYCLGRYETEDDAGMDGAYLMYLDIGTNAAKTERTTVYEHYKEIRKVFEYPAGVAIVSVSTVADNIENQTQLDETNTANFLIVAGTSGTITVTRAANDVEMARTNGLLTSAKPTLVGDLMWDDSHQQYNIHDPGGNNLSSAIVSEDTFTEVRRLQYYDWNVNMAELMITHITDTSTDSGETWERTYYQEYADGTSTTTFSDMKIYNTANGTKYLTESDLTSVTAYLVTNGTPQINNTLMLKITYQEDNGEDIVYDWVLTLDIDESATTGHYYTITTGAGQYVFAATLENGTVTLKVVSIVAGGKTIKINGTTITTAGQTVTIVPAQNP